MPPGVTGLGWGVLDAGAAVDAIRRLDRLAPVSQLTAPRLHRPRRDRAQMVRPRPAPPGLVTSGIAYYDVYAATDGGRPRRIARSHRHSLTFDLSTGQTYTFYSVAVDRAGNRQSKPVRAVVHAAG